MSEQTNTRARKNYLAEPAESGRRVYWTVSMKGSLSPGKSLFVEEDMFEGEQRGGTAVEDEMGEEERHAFNLLQEVTITRRQSTRQKNIMRNLSEIAH